MFEQNDKIFYIDLIDGTVEEARFMEYENEGMWIRLKGQSVNKFVYKEDAPSRIYSDKIEADTSLAEIRSKTKANLLSGNRFVEDITKRLSKNEGSFYTGIIKEILEEKIR